MFTAYIHFNRGPAKRVKYNLLPALREHMAVNIPDPMAGWDFTVAPAGGAAATEAGGGPAVVVVAERGPAAAEAAAVGGPNLVTQVLESSDRLELLEQLFGSLPVEARNLLIRRTSKKTELLSLLQSLEVYDSQWSFQ